MKGDDVANTYSICKPGGGHGWRLGAPTEALTEPLVVACSKVEGTTTCPKLEGRHISQKKKRGAAPPALGSAIGPRQRRRQARQWRPRDGGGESSTESEDPDLVAGSGADFDVHDGGFGVGGDEVLEEKVGVGAGAVGGGDDDGAMECQEEGADGGWDGEGGVEGELGGAPVVFLQWRVELSRIVHQQTQNVVLCHVTRHLVLWHFQHFHSSKTEKRGMRKKTPTTIQQINKTHYTVWGSRKRLEEEK
ncbi:hypothetical protein LR48_Vigan05g010500 [Vigna angularis]|uniref:Uncharacterized protein n=1 Tax=Phaseolus angularis TaxID=3914 RepID=A0A0L9UIJ4_PHAAN|nr:hypothetical protein LR48_Vigan05g010500 [Vigna angularis]